MNDGIVERFERCAEQVEQVLACIGTTQVEIKSSIKTAMLVKKHVAACMKSRLAVHNGLAQGLTRPLLAHDFNMMDLVIMQAPLKPAATEAHKATTSLLSVKRPMVAAGNILREVRTYLFSLLAHTSSRTPAHAPLLPLS